MLEIFVENGAPKDILYSHKPHIGTDLLITVVKNMRQRILDWGGEVHFHSQMTDIHVEDGKLTAITVTTDAESIRCQRYLYWQSGTAPETLFPCSMKDRFR